MGKSSTNPNGDTNGSKSTLYSGFSIKRPVVNGMFIG